MNLGEGDHRESTARLGLVVGMFDGVHLGHRFLIDHLIRETAVRELLPAVFTFPSHPLSVVNPEQSPRLLTTPEEKLRLLSDTGIGSRRIFFQVFSNEFRGLRASEFMGMLHERYDVDFILRGFNNRFGTERNLSPEDYRRIAGMNGIELVDASDYCHGEAKVAVCSSLIRNALLKGEIEEANIMLGYPYPVSGLVVGGKHLGRTMGFPTANINIRHGVKLVPSDGVYVCLAESPEGVFKAMVNIGTRPTIDGLNLRRTIEAHLLEYNGDLYGKELTLRFFRRLRPEMRFPSVEDLCRQLESDREDVRGFDYQGYI